jgi:hypothetical protein
MILLGLSPFIASGRFRRDQGGSHDVDVSPSSVLRVPHRGFAVTIDCRKWLLAPLASIPLGCGLAPKSFQKVTDPAPIVRARSIGLSGRLPEHKAVPALIDRLEDRDPVVRLAAYEELKKGTGRSFGFIPWSSEAERAHAVARWRSWWNARQEDVARLAQKL